MNLSILEVGASLDKINTRRPKESREQYLARSIHILLSGKSLERIENLNYCNNISRLYLYDNSISSIEGLGECTGLVQLYLQNNQIRNIDGLESLSMLKVLHLGHNLISVVECECFVGLASLETLHLEHQSVEKDLQLEPGCFQGLESLTTLVISENRLQGIDQFGTIPKLRTLNLSTCEITIEQWPVLFLTLTIHQDIKSTLPRCSSLVSLDMLINPILTQFTNLRRNVILSSSSITKFNNKNINPNERACLLNMERAKLRIKHQKALPVKPILVEVEELGGGVVPHLPAYASQYRDLIIHQMDRRRKKESDNKTVEFGIGFDGTARLA